MADSKHIEGLSAVLDYIRQVDATFKEAGLGSIPLAAGSTAETALLAVQAALRLTERLVAVEMEFEAFTLTLLQNAPLAIMLVDEGGIIRAWNPSAIQLYGWQPDEVVGLPLADVIVPERYRARHVAGFERFVRTRQSSGMLSRTFRTPALRAAGDEIEIEAMILPVHVRNQFGFLSFSRDFVVPIATASPHIDSLLAAAPTSPDAPTE